MAAYMGCMRMSNKLAKQLAHGGLCSLIISENSVSLLCRRSNINYNHTKCLSFATHRQKLQTDCPVPCPRNFDIVNKSSSCYYMLQTHSYSSKGSGTTVNITDDILKSKLTQEPDPSDDKKGKESSKDEKNSKEDENKSKSWFSSQNAWKLGLVCLGGMSILTGFNLLFTWGAPAIDQDGNEIIDEFTSLPKWKAYPLRAKKEFYFYKKLIQEPSSKKLLPDPLKEPYYQPPYTLVLEMTGVLVHPDWTLNTGWRFKKRPGIDYFLQQVGPPIFEVVIFTHEQGMTAYPIVDGIDPKGYVAYRLFRDATKWQDGAHIKDLECLNRDLSKVIVVDCDPQSVKLQPRNAIPLKKWKGDDDDRTLMDLAAFLRTIAASNIEDVRTVLDYYNQFDDPIQAFKENQRKLQEEQTKATQSSTEQTNKNLTKGWAAGLTGRRR